RAVLVERAVLHRPGLEGNAVGGGLLLPIGLRGQKREHEAHGHRSEYMRWPMLATRIRQKEGAFYFVSYKVPDLLAKVRFVSRYALEGEDIEAEPPAAHGEDEVARFIASVEKSESAFQRTLNKRKIGAIVNFFETAVTQPLV